MFVQCARQGFATALTAVITALPVLQGKALLQIIPSNLEVTSSMKKQVFTHYCQIFGQCTEVNKDVRFLNSQHLI